MKRKGKKKAELKAPIRFKLPKRPSLSGPQEPNNPIILVCTLTTIGCATILVTLYYPFIPPLVRLFAIPLIMIGSYFVATRVVSPLIENQLSDKLDRNGFPKDKEFTRDPEWQRSRKSLKELRRGLVIAFAMALMTLLLPVLPPDMVATIAPLMVVGAIFIGFLTVARIMSESEEDSKDNNAAIDENSTIYYLTRKNALGRRITSIIATAREDLRHVPSTPLLGAFLFVALFIAGILFSLMH